MENANMTTPVRLGAAAALAVACLASWSGPVGAQSAEARAERQASVAAAVRPDTGSEAAPAAAATAVPADASTTPGGLLGGHPIAMQELDARRGGTNAHNDMRLDGMVGSNHASNLVTGANTISSGAFAGSAGLPMVIQNSGNNVLIQNATIVNVQIK